MNISNDSNCITLKAIKKHFLNSLFFLSSCKKNTDTKLHVWDTLTASNQYLPLKQVMPNKDCHGDHSYKR